MVYEALVRVPVAGSDDESAQEAAENFVAFSLGGQARLIRVNRVGGDMSNMNNAEAHVYAEVYKAVYDAHAGKMDTERRLEAEHCARQAVWTFLDAQPRYQGAT